MRTENRVLSKKQMTAELKAAGYEVYTGKHSKWTFVSKGGGCEDSFMSLRAAHNELIINKQTTE